MMRPGSNKLAFLIKNILSWLVTLVMLVPLALIVINSFKTKNEANKMTLALPTEWVFDNFSTVIEKGKLVGGFFNSMIYAGGSTLLAVTFAAMAAYMFSRRQTKASRAAYFYLVLGIVIPINFISLMKVMQILQINNTRLGIVLLYTAIQLPFMTFLIYGFIAKLPIELDEAGILDGCGPLRLFFSIIFPLLKPVLISASVLCFLNTWNEFVLPLYFLNSTTKWPMTLAVYSFFGQFDRYWNLICADILLTSLPVIVIYLACQKYIIGGQTAGAVKG